MRRHRTGCADAGVVVGRNASTVPGLGNVLILAPPFVIEEHEGAPRVAGAARALTTRDHHHPARASRAFCTQRTPFPRRPCFIKCARVHSSMTGCASARAGRSDAGSGRDAGLDLCTHAPERAAGSAGGGLVARRRRRAAVSSAGQPGSRRKLPHDRGRTGQGSRKAEKG